MRCRLCVIVAAVTILSSGASAARVESAVKDSLRTANRLKLEVAGERISELVAYSQGLKTGRGVTETERNGTAAREITALYQALWARDDGEDAEE